MTKLAIILGTRPEIIKMGPIIRACQKHDIPFFILHTGQHYDQRMDKAFFEDLELPEPKYNLQIGGKPYRQQVGIMIRDIQDILIKEAADTVIVQGDTNTVLAGALAANKLSITLAHHEAGLRSHDLTMPEEKNRIITDHISDLLFTPTLDAMRNLVDEGLPFKRITHTGNTIVDAVLENVEIAKRKSTILNRLDLGGQRYFLVTAHRAENVDIEERLRGIMEGLARIASDGTRIIFPLHPRTKSKMAEFSVPAPRGVTFIEPVGFLDCLMLEKHARLIITDSGGLQEEASILHVPCVTIRDNTERPETIAAGINVLAGTDPDRIVACAEEMLAKEHDWPQLFGDGTAGEQIVLALHRRER